jgi:transmembrane sensor
VRPGAASPSSEEQTNERAESWREHAEGGDFKSAFPLLPKTDTMTTMSVSDLLLAADAARLSGHPREALPFLTRVVEAHAEDTRAPLAAFTLGGVLMHQLGLPREAEAAYARARSTTTSEALAQDALARQVEAASRAGDDALAQKLARVYLDKYPEGRRVNAVRRFGRL